MDKQTKQLLALTTSARKNPKYRAKIKAKIKAIKEKQRVSNWLSQ